MSTDTRPHPLLDKLLLDTLSEYPVAADLMKVGDVEGAKAVLDKAADALADEGDNPEEPREAAGLAKL